VNLGPVPRGHCGDGFDLDEDFVKTHEVGLVLRHPRN
jgi:hypothetical protein